MNKTFGVHQFYSNCKLSKYNHRRFGISNIVINTQHHLFIWINIPQGSHSRRVPEFRARFDTVLDLHQWPTHDSVTLYADLCLQTTRHCQQTTRL